MLSSNATSARVKLFVNALPIFYLHLEQLCFSLQKVTVLLKINHVQFQSYTLKYVNLDPHLNPGHVSPRKVTVKSAQHFARSNAKKGTELTSGFLKIAVI